MARRRYLSTDISKDRRVADLMARAGMAAPLLYTWLIPHAEDDASLPSDPEELLGTVAPILGMRGMIAISDVLAFIEAAVDLGLLERDGCGLRFPASFFKYQTYIKGERRGTPQPEPPVHEPEPTAPDANDRSDSPRISADQRTTPQNVASSSFSSPVLVSSSSPAPIGAARTPVPKPKPTHPPVDDEYIETLVSEFSSQLGGPDGVRFAIEAALNHKARDKAIDQRLYVRGWLRRDAQRSPKVVPIQRSQPPRSINPAVDDWVRSLEVS